MLNCSTSLVMSTSVLEALLGKFDIKRHSPCILYLAGSKSTHCVIPFNDLAFIYVIYSRYVP